MRTVRTMMLGTALIAAPALAQTTAKDNVAVKHTHSVDDGGPSRGANSFTQAQAREHIARSGFTDVSPLTKDGNGVWRGTARKGGRIVHVGLDFKGNVATGR